MKAAIMTLALSPNYGAQLQSYALARAITDLGIDVEVISYIDKKRMTYGMSTISKIKFYSWGIIKKLIWGDKKEKSFSQFRTRYVPMTMKVYNNNKELQSDPGDYDIYIAGSDQIWNPDIFQYDLSYFLNFVPLGKKKISYASSFAKKTFESVFERQCSDLLKQFSYLSVRESSGVAIINKLTQRSAEVVLDPTLLLNKSQWMDVIIGASEKARSFNGILCYIMPGDINVTNEIERLASQIRERTGLPIMRLGIKEYTKKRYKPEECDVEASPSDFVQYFLNSKYVVTNSFHGTAFSINFGKQLIVPYNDELPRELALHERMVSLLSMLHAEEVLCPLSHKNFELPDRDVNMTNILLQKEREKSWEYLRNSLEV